METMTLAPRPKVTRRQRPEPRRELTAGERHVEEKYFDSGAVRARVTTSSKPLPINETRGKCDIWRTSVEGWDEAKVDAYLKQVRLA
jgi:hypothetical protein